MLRVPLVLMGFGNVGRAFFQLVHEKKALCRSRCGLDFFVGAVFELGGALVADIELDPILIPEKSASEIKTNPAWNANAELKDVLTKLGSGVLIECTPSNLKTGEPGFTHIRKAFDAGWHAATASKGPLVVAYKSLKRLAHEKGVALKFSGATAAALPTLDVGLFSLAGTEILEIEGILNGTTNFILTRMGEGAAYADALREAQELGVAEPNPSMDVEGWDTAVKTLLIANAVMGLELTLSDLSVEGITNIPPLLPGQTKKEGKTLKLLGRIYREGDKIRAGVGPALLSPGHPLFGVNGTAKGITFLTDTMGSVTVTGGKSDPRGAAAALLKDIINIFLGRI